MAITVFMGKMDSTDCGRYGKAMEMAMTGMNHLKPQYRPDWTHLRETFEVKTGAGELFISNRTGGLVHGKKVLFIPVPVTSIDFGYEWLDPYEQEGFILDSDRFIEILKEIGLFRESKKRRDGAVVSAIQTFWNRKKNAPHGKGYERLMDALYSACDNGEAEEFSEFLERTYGEE